MVSDRIQAGWGQPPQRKAPRIRAGWGGALSTLRYGGGNRRGLHTKLIK